MKTIYGIIIGVGLCFVLLFYILFANNSSVSAQAADSVLRPLLGSKETLLLESMYFNTLDTVAGIKYRFAPQAASMFSPALQPLSSQAYAQGSNQMDLAALPIDHSLPPLSGEGIWTPIAQNLFPKQAVLARTILRPDKDKPYALVTLVKMNLDKLGIGLQGGTFYPGGDRHVYGPGIVPNDIQKANTLVAVFNGGFQEKDGEYGMTIGKTVYVPLRNDLPALLLFSDGSASFITYHGQQLPKDVVAVRQNGPFLIENGKITSFTEAGTDTWGRTTTNSMYTWRSGMGITKNGNIVYAVGNDLVPQTLAKALLAAGAVNAIQLDINPFWVRFIVYQSLGYAQYSYTSLLANMQNGGFDYLHGYNKDFFYVYKK